MNLQRPLVVAKLFLFILIFILFNHPVLARPTTPSWSAHPKQGPPFFPSLQEKRPIFIENVGQFDQAVRFQIRDAIGHSLWLTDQAIWITLLKSTGSEPLQVQQGLRLKLSFGGPDITRTTLPRLEPFNAVDVPISYFGPGDSGQTQSEPVPVWTGVRYVDLYPGLDLELTSQVDGLTWRFVVRDFLSLYKSGFSSLQDLQLQVAGAKQVTLSTEGQVLVETSLGQVKLPLLPVLDNSSNLLDLSATSPRVIETADSLQGNIIVAPFTQDIQPRFQHTPLLFTPSQTMILATPTPMPQPEATPDNVNSFNDISSKMGGPAFKNDRSPAATTTLITTPVQTSVNTTKLSYSTFIGGEGSDCFETCIIAIDAGGSAYLIGHTASNIFAETSGVFRVGSPGNGDIFILKLAPGGRRIQYLTFLGGRKADYGTAMAVDRLGHVYITGYTNSADFPVTSTAAFSEYGGGRTDAFLVKLSHDGRTLDYATFFGGSENDQAYALAVDREGQAFIAGDTISADLLTSSAALNRQYQGRGDIFVAQFEATGQHWTYATFLGGSGEDKALALALDLVGNIYLTGQTRSYDLDISDETLDAEHNGLGDAYLMVLSPRTVGDTFGYDLTYATFIGGVSQDIGYALALDTQGFVYLTGATLSYDFPVTKTAFDPQHEAGYDAFVLKLDPNSNKLIYSTLLGGSGGDRGRAIVVDDQQQAYVVGTTYSADFPRTTEAIGGGNKDGYADAFLVKLTADGTDLRYATRLGGSHSEDGTRLAFDGADSIYLTGSTLSADFPITEEAIDSTYNGDWDAFITRLKFDDATISYLIAGIVRDQAGYPIPETIISAGGQGSTSVGKNGMFTLIGFNAGTYTLQPIKPGYTFSPERRIINIPNHEGLLAFIGLPEDDAPAPFLSLPLEAGPSPLDTIRALRDTDNQGVITAWFDHAYPEFIEGKNQDMVIWDGQKRTQGLYNADLGCYEQRCYDSHNGLDMVYRDRRVSLRADVEEPIENKISAPILAAGDGIVVKVQTGCLPGDSDCGWGYGNYVIIDHQNGYFTLYGHLASVSVKNQQIVQQNDPIGEMGSTGYSTNTHLHFSVFKDNGNGYWDGQKVDKPVDPFGWQGDEVDPWVIDRQGPKSYYLWQEDLWHDISFVGPQGAVLEDATQSIQVAVPPYALLGEATLNLFLGPVPEPTHYMRSVGYSFWLYLSEWTPGAIASPDGVLPSSSLALSQPITLTVSFTQSDILHLNPDRIAIRRWDETSQVWQTLPTTVDMEAGTASARASSLGDFDLQAPLLCGGDIFEPDDSYFVARALEVFGTPQVRLFDMASDEDWFRFHARADMTYRVQTANLAAGVGTQIDIYDLGSSELMASGETVIEWDAPQTGTYYARISRVASSTYGCEAYYDVRVQEIGATQHQIFLPMVRK